MTGAAGNVINHANSEFVDATPEPLAMCLERMCTESRAQLEHMTSWWQAYAIDELHGGFFGEVDGANQPDPQADKGLVLNARILWFFSSLANQKSFKNTPLVDAAHKLADRAYTYWRQHFMDTEYGGSYWCVDYTGKPRDKKKQVYAQAFMIYGLSAYYQLTQDESALTKALQHFQLLEENCRDKDCGGYYEYTSVDWGTIGDAPMSAKDLPAAKTMNNHLHIMEAYTALYAATQDERVKESLSELIHCMMERIFDSDTCHLKLFLSRDWKDLSQTYSFGHDIEFSWLLGKALMVLGDANLSQQYARFIRRVVDVCIDEGFSDEGELRESFRLSSKTFDSHNEWWVQAEALVGLINAYALSRDFHYLKRAEDLWRHIKEQYVDDESGEWFFSPRETHGLQGDAHKLSFWKGPYHNGRAMLEMFLRCRALLDIGSI